MTVRTSIPLSVIDPPWCYELRLWLRDWGYTPGAGEACTTTTPTYLAPASIVVFAEVWKWPSNGDHQWAVVAVGVTVNVYLNGAMIGSGATMNNGKTTGWTIAPAVGNHTLMAEMPGITCAGAVCNVCGVCD